MSKRQIQGPQGAPRHLIPPERTTPPGGRISGPMPKGFDPAHCAGKLKGSIAQGSKRGKGSE